jgi:hypothetical protein
LHMTYHAKSVFVDRMQGALHAPMPTARTTV